MKPLRRTGQDYSSAPAPVRREATRFGVGMVPPPEITGHRRSTNSILRVHRRGLLAGACRCLQHGWPADVVGRPSANDNDGTLLLSPTHRLSNDAVHAARA